jgi:hypothetical protein
MLNCQAAANFHQSFFNAILWWFCDYGAQNYCSGAYYYHHHHHQTQDCTHLVRIVWEMAAWHQTISWYEHVHTLVFSDVLLPFASSSTQLRCHLGHEIENVSNLCCVSSAKLLAIHCCPCTMQPHLLALAISKKWQYLPSLPYQGQDFFKAMIVDFSYLYL